MAEMFIGGQQVSFPELERFPVINPATGETVETIPLATEQEVDYAVRNAYSAFPDWAATPAAKRGEILYKAANLVRAHLEDLARMLVLEQGKPIREARLEIGRFIDTVEHYAGLAKNLRGGYVPSLDAGTYGLVLKRPIGVVAAIVPWNFPTTLLGNKLGPALITGNVVVAKPAETTPLTTLRIAALFREAGLPPGVFNVVTGLGPVVGEALVLHPLVRKVAFTGSTLVGKRIMALASQRVKRVTLELGGSDPMIVCDDADIEAAAKAAAVGRFFNCGQACVAVKRLYVFRSVYEKFMEALIPRVRKLRLGPGLEESTQMGPLHSEKQRRTIEEQVEDARERGGQILAGGKRPESHLLSKGFFFEPTVILEPSLESRVAQEEVFGPVLPVWRVENLQEAVDLANRSPYGLGGTVFTSNLERVSYVLETLNVGYIWVNSVNRIYDELPFGGTKESGFGKEHGIEALEDYQETRAAVIRWR